jgi:hypothetical protein
VNPCLQGGAGGQGTPLIVLSHQSCDNCGRTCREDVADWRYDFLLECTCSRKDVACISVSIFEQAQYMLYSDNISILCSFHDRFCALLESDGFKIFLQFLSSKRR